MLLHAGEKFVSISSNKTTAGALRGAGILAVLSVIGPATGLAAQTSESKAPPPKAAPPHPAAKQGAVPAAHGPQNANGRPVPPNSITMGHPGQPRGPVRPGGQPCMNCGPHPGPHPELHPGPNPRPNPGPTAGAHPVLATGTHIAQGGGVYTVNPHGQLTHFYDPRTGMNVEHLSGNRIRAVTERDGRRIVSEGDRGYEQRVYSFHGQEFAHRTYVDHGRTYERIYSPYAYHGVRMEAYRPSRYYSAGFYGWAGRPWTTPVHYGWGWQADPWYAYYGPYFAPAPVYITPTLWLTDYIIADSLQSGYAAQDAAIQGTYGPPSGATSLTPAVKQQIADEVQHQMQQENAEAQANAQGRIPGGPVGVAALFGDNQPHVFVAGSDLNLTDLSSGRPCQITQGDVLQVRTPPAGNNTFVTATVLASKGGPDCGSAANVSVSLNDLQDMNNHMRETADEGMRELQARQGQNGLPAAPPEATAPPVAGAFVDAAPTSDPQVANEIIAQGNAANQAEQQAGLRDINLTPAAGTQPQGATAAPPTITAGQSIAAVVGSMGNPATIVNLGAKQIYIYKSPGTKITFVNGKVTDVE